MVNCVGVASQIWQGGWSNKWLAINRQKCHFTQQMTITCLWSSFNSWYPRDIVLYFYSFINGTLFKSLISHLILSSNVTYLCHSIILENCQHACSNLIGTPKLVLKAKFCIAAILDSSMPPPPHTLKRHGQSPPLSGVWTVGRSLILWLILIVS